MSLNPLQQISFHILIGIVPIFTLWWMLVTPVIMPGFALPVGFAISQWFERERIEIQPTSEGKWNIYTKILLKKQPENAKRSFVLSLQLKPLTVFTIGLPLLWILLIAIPETWRQKLWNLLIGSCLLIPPILLSLWLEVFRHIAQLMSGDDVGEILVTEGLYQAVYPYSAEVISIATMLVKLSVYTNFVIFPMLIVYLLHRNFIRAFFLTNLINSQPKTVLQ